MAVACFSPALCLITISGGIEGLVTANSVRCGVYNVICIIYSLSRKRALSLTNTLPFTTVLLQLFTPLHGELPRAFACKKTVIGVLITSAGRGRKGVQSGSRMPETAAELFRHDVPVLRTSLARHGLVDISTSPTVRRPSVGVSVLAYGYYGRFYHMYVVRRRRSALLQEQQSSIRHQTRSGIASSHRWWRAAGIGYRDTKQNAAFLLLLICTLPTSSRSVQQFPVTWTQPYVPVVRLLRIKL